MTVSVLWSNRISNFLTCWGERHSKNSLSIQEERGKFLALPSSFCAIFNAVLYLVLGENLSDVCFIWSLVLIKVTVLFILLGTQLWTELERVSACINRPPSRPAFSPVRHVWLERTVTLALFTVYCRGVSLFGPRDFVIKITLSPGAVVCCHVSW